MNDLVTQLIEEITPLNNKYREAINANLPGKEILKIMWEVGEILFLHKIKNIHPIAWKIYGKEKGIRRSYITRDFLSYCFRIRKYFKNKAAIEEKFPTLQKYSLFREAFPLLENPKYDISEEERITIIKLLNSNSPIQVIKKRIVGIKREKNRIYNDRRQRLNEMVPLRDNFKEIYNDLSALLGDGDISRVGVLREQVGKNLILLLSQLCLSLTQEGLKFPKIDKNQIDNLKGKWKIFCRNLIMLSNSHIETRNRFRRLVPISKIMEVAEILNGLRSDEGFSNLASKLKGFELKRK